MKTYIRITASLLALALSCCAAPVLAVTITATAPSGPQSAGALLPIQIRLSTDNDAINVVEGSVSIPAGIQVQTVSTAGSAMTLWTSVPVYSVTDQTVTFAGGVPGGIAAHSDVLLFTIYGSAPTPGPYSFSPQDIRAYRNDGKGTLLAVSLEPADITVGPASASAQTPDAALNALRAQDKAAPELVVAEIGKDPSLFGDKYFLTAYGSDKDSGIAYFEAREGATGAFTRFAQYYVLKDQDLDQPIEVHAVDAAGNVRTQILSPQNPPSKIVFFVVCLLTFWTLLRILADTFAPQAFRSKKSLSS